MRDFNFDYNRNRLLFFASYNHCYVHVRVPLFDSAIIELQPFVIPFVHQSFQLVDFRRFDNLRRNSQHIVCAIQIVLPVCIYHGMRRFGRITRIVGCQICNDIFRRDVSKTVLFHTKRQFRFVLRIFTHTVFCMRLSKILLPSSPNVPFKFGFFGYTRRRDIDTSARRQNKAHAVFLQNPILFAIKF